MSFRIERLESSCLRQLHCHLYSFF